MRYGGREVGTNFRVEGPGVYTKIWWEGNHRVEKTYILDTTPAGTERRTEIRPETLSYEIDDNFVSERLITEGLKCLAK